LRRLVFLGMFLVICLGVQIEVNGDAPWCRALAERPSALLSERKKKDPNASGGTTKMDPNDNI
jgi:hypothetical protein